MHRTLRASARGVAARRRGAPMASLLAFSSSSLPLNPSPPSTAPSAPTPASASSARPPRLRLLLARAAARRDPEPAPPPAAAVSERKSLAVRTGELFLGLAALLVRVGRGAAPVEEVEEREGVVWEQRRRT